MPFDAETSPATFHAITSTAATTVIPVPSQCRRATARSPGSSSSAIEITSTTERRTFTSPSSKARSRFAIWTIESPSASAYGKRSSWKGVVRMT